MHLKMSPGKCQPSCLSLNVLTYSPPSAPYMCQWIGSALVQIMACRLLGAKPLSEPMLTYCQLEPKEYISMKYHFKLNYFHSRKCVWTCRLRNGGHFVQGRWVKEASPVCVLVLHQPVPAIQPAYSTNAANCYKHWTEPPANKTISILMPS